MSTAYHTKALPLGTTLREWRLEEILGAGGFGIVYRGRGTYFDEEVAIKEYFPSAISDRIDGETVKPTDSSSEEIYELGLQKFLEEAKVLWNLSKPERHPNIVSVRSLFEIHGTAYMVMDFEKGVSMSQMLREGRSFDETSLMALLRPIALGLERAHQGGVVHRDIKPANILVDEQGRPVLIDFGSARFDAGQATSTKVTFYTPPYAALEQYVKTYPQGAWTDIYALGVVAYQCITGEKPPEVLERLHGGLGETLSAKTWPGYSPAFTRAIDAAMGIRPNERPQSISEWLKLFDAPDEPADEDFTQITVRATPAPAPEPEPPSAASVAPPPPAAPTPQPEKAAASAEPQATPLAEADVDAAAAQKRRTYALIGAGGVAATLMVGAAALMFSKPHQAAISAASSAPALAAPAAPVAAAPSPGGPSISPQIEPGARALLAAAQQAKRPPQELSALSDAASRIDALAKQLAALPAPASHGAEAQTLIGQVDDAATKMAKDEARALAASAQAQARDAQRILGKAAKGSDAGRALQTLLQAKGKVQAATDEVAQAGDPAGALSAAAGAMPAAQQFADAYKDASSAFVPAEQAELTGLVNDTRAMFGAIQSYAARPKPWFLAPQRQKAAYQTLQDTAAQAKTQAATLGRLAQAALGASDLKSVQAAIVHATAIKKQMTALYASASAAAAVK